MSLKDENKKDELKNEQTLVSVSSTQESKTPANYEIENLLQVQK